MFYTWHSEDLDICNSITFVIKLNDKVETMFGNELAIKLKERNILDIYTRDLKV